MYEPFNVSAMNTYKNSFTATNMTHDICNLPALTDILTFFSVPLNPLTSSTSLDLLVEYELFINTLYFTPLLLLHLFLIMLSLGKQAFYREWIIEDRIGIQI